jgi:hypothetical protein
MKTKIKLPNGSMTCNETMTTVDLTPNGVVCRDCQRRILAWIPVKDPDKAKIVVNIMSDFAMAGIQAKQPSWDFLLDEIEPAKS